MLRFGRAALQSVLCLGLVLALCACGTGEAPVPESDPDEGTPPLPQDGALVWADNGCGSCHAADGSGGFGPDVRCTDAARLDTYIRTAGTSHFAGAYPALTLADLNALVAFLDTGDCDGGGGGTLDCFACHNVAQDNGDNTPAGGRRAVTAEFSMASHHGAGADTTAADCVVCHDMTQHMQGRVRLLDVDQAGSVIELLGDPLQVPAEALKLEVFCLACHDADGAAGAAPFSDGRMPTPVSSSGWTQGAHNSGALTCFGDGSTAGCHSSGHGAEEHALLASRYDIQSPTTSYSAARYQACWNCHSESATVGGKNAFEELHKKHVQEEKAACATCHDPHGSYDAGEPGNLSFARALDRGYPFQLPTGTTLSSAFDAGAGPSNCTVRCHGETHNAWSYQEEEED